MNMMADPVGFYRPACLSAEDAALARHLSRRRYARNLGGFDLLVVAPPEVIADPVAFDIDRKSVV